MLQRINTEQKTNRALKQGTQYFGNVRIDVFTSSYCSFCGDALEVAKSAAGRASYLSGAIEVVETSVDERPELIEALNLVALPLIQIGTSQIIGLPNQEDIERLIHEKILMG